MGYVGLSLSFCVRDIAEGRVSLNEVEKIITGTKATTGAEWRDVFDKYQQFYWYNKPAECLHIARQLLRAGKIEQPRFRGEEAAFVGDYHWLLNGKPVFNRKERSVRLSRSSNVEDSKHAVEINVVTGETRTVWPQWSLMLSNRTGRIAAGNEVLVTFAPFNHQGMMTDFVFVNDIGNQFLIRIGARDSFERVAATQIWGPCDNEKGSH